MKNILIKSIEAAFKKLAKNDGMLFNCPVENSNDNIESRKLYEVCINHKLAQYLEEYFFKAVPHAKIELFVDIEFNRNGNTEKPDPRAGRTGNIRPDIILHNRKSDESKRNLLIVECKKDNISAASDIQKIKAMMQDTRYKYEYGLMVKYTPTGVEGKFLFKDNNNQIIEERIITSQPRSYRNRAKRPNSP